MTKKARSYDLTITFNEHLALIDSHNPENRLDKPDPEFKYAARRARNIIHEKFSGILCNYTHKDNKVRVTLPSKGSENREIIADLYALLQGTFRRGEEDPTKYVTIKPTRQKSPKRASRLERSMQRSQDEENPLEGIDFSDTSRTW